MTTRNPHPILEALALVAALAVGTTAAAQQGTVITTGGERVTGHVRDMDDRGFTVQVDGSERRLMIPQIAVVDFATGRAPNSGELDRLRQGRQMVVLKDGTALVGQISNYERTMPGQLVDLPKEHAFRIRFQVADGGGERTFLSSEVARIYFRDPTDVLRAGTQGPIESAVARATASGPHVTVLSNQPWTPTGIAVRRGQSVRLESSGKVQLSASSEDVSEPAGNAKGRLATNAPLPRVPAGALIARVGAGAPFAIGDLKVVTMPANGYLFLGVNDDGYADNSGEYIVAIDTGTTSARPR